MILTPAAKPIRIRIVSGGEEHSSLDSLRKNFSIKDLRPLVSDGRLVRWLRQKGESELAERISKFEFKKIEFNPDRNEALKFISFFFPEYEDIESVRAKWGENKEYENNLKYLEKYLEIVPRISEAMERYKDDPGRYSKEEWVMILKHGTASEVIKLIENRDFLDVLKLMGEEEWHYIFLAYGDTTDSEILLKMGIILSNTDKYNIQGKEYIEKSAQLGNDQAKSYIKKRSSKYLLNNFPNSMQSLDDNEKYLSYLQRFLTIMEIQYRDNKPFECESLDNLGKYTNYLKLSNDLWHYRLATSNNKRKYIQNITEYRNFKAKEQVQTDYINNRIYNNGKPFRELNFREYLQYIINLVKTFEDYE